MQYKLSSILIKKTLRQFGLFRQICLFRQSCPCRQIHRSPYGRSRTDSDGFRTLEIVKKYVYVFTLWVYSDYCIYRYISIHTHICILYVLRKGRQEAYKVYCMICYTQWKLMFRRQVVYSFYINHIIYLDTCYICSVYIF